MVESSPSKPPRRRPPRAGLAHKMRRVSSKELRSLVSERTKDLTSQEMRQALLNPHLTEEIIEELLLARHLLSIYEIRRSLARHRRTAETTAIRFVASLFWRDLLEITLDVRIRPTVRRQAENYIIQRLPRLTVGDKTTLARRATGPVAAHLRNDPNQRVITALLENARLTEDILAPLAAESTSPRILDLLAANPRWGRRGEIRKALAKNGATPFRATLAILPTLTRADLVEIAADAVHSVVIRNRAAEVLETFDRFDRPGIDSAALS